MTTRHHDELHHGLQCPLKDVARAVPGCGSCDRYLAMRADAQGCLIPGAAGRLCVELAQREPVTLDVELGVREALTVLSGAQLPSAPVLDDNAFLLGVATWHELFAYASRPDAEVEDVMTRALSAHVTTSVEGLRRVMHEHRAPRVHIVDDDGRLVGVVTALELLQWS